MSVPLPDDGVSKRPQFGNRLLHDMEQVFQHNAWDHVEWDAEQEEEAKRKVSENSSVHADEELVEKYEVDAFKYWDDFYGIHQNRFFKDRRWIFTEFPEIAPDIPNEVPLKDEASVNPSSSDSKSETNFESKNKEGEGDCDELVKARQSDSEGVHKVNDSHDSCSLIGSNRVNILEVGCGVGNTVFPILQTSANPNLFVYCCDFSSTAIKLVQENPEYDVKRCHAFVCDVTSDDWNAPFPPNSLDFVILIFVLSAIHPDKMRHVASKLFYYLKPGGMVMFRDYGLYDMAQLRFKKGRCLADNFYARGDGTRVYFFTQEGLRDIFEGVGFKEKENIIDRRLQVNRGKLLKMYRVWVQAKYQKPLLE
ncbi:tRNA N(3)-methylcytidine methyltransferase METTL2 isoform X2 [Ischnura elegans]|uniref:tRNA N(3)-methylcytidine methyltransferase METTL2 isoform X2 n=1 Tax=Ischnura elegans TaxID=197161 RepID=UPI001ED87886|nr:tRNA N(3)-methylcytidine methyltransferase METTL2 isoform X2 [Ischnura elegans]